MREKIFTIMLLIIFLLILSCNDFFIPRIFAQDKDSAVKTISHPVLVELFIQEACTSCPTAEFCLEDLAWEYGTTKLILVQEHLWGDGYDTPETNTRYDWYVGNGKKGTPDVFIDGLTKRLQGLACDCVEENYECYKAAIDKELIRLSLLEFSAVKIPHPNPLPQGERGKNEELSEIIIEGTVKNISDKSLKNLAVCGMAGKEGDEPGLYFYIQDIFPFQDIPPFKPGDTFNFKFFPEIPLAPNSEVDVGKDTSHFVIFVQNTKTKEILQSLYIE